MSTIAAICTSQGIGGIGVVRISGENSIKIADSVFKSNSKLDKLKGYTAKFGKIIENGEFIDEAIALVFRAPHSYTGENVVEISCHGGLFLVRRLLRAVLNAGAELAKAGEFTKRAFLNGKLDLTQAESVIDLINSKTEKSNRLAFDVKQGVTYKKILSIKEKILDIISSLDAWIDYPEEDIPEIKERNLIENLSVICEKINKLINTYDYGKIIKSGIKTVILGKPNVGKSTLMNLLSGTQKSIVTDIPGTTRDVIEETILLGDIQLSLLDTAGIRKTDNLIEKIGVEKSKDELKTADLVFVLLDNSRELSQEDIEILDFTKNKKRIVIINKTDLEKKLNLNFELENIVNFSAKNEQGLNDLKNMLYKIINIENSDENEVIISNERQLDCLKRSLKLLNFCINDLKNNVTLDVITILLQEVLDVLNELTGENTNEELINKIFSKFCVGK
ncbi:MAG: tRNA uridine-5-carboxymethylaminomethyl(34) synthesis GTPase MnmE [Candidatus Paraimprobicoccus trichonymphae]|uniref:tRNA modification GTPase MnmE n=1 Tax=Candidatus Paraimprobicoccus trichonymphae TaxID=3033793 RepID=A0AA48HW15_9FIRM|nr:MAG: tRNA uridine-5-carboxymethylaminomethyl(34) synthesis GTPase MnmE [Candidatus Paraimprobicoccus trichonymphae]